MLSYPGPLSVRFKAQSQTQCCNTSETKQTLKDGQLPEVCSGLLNKNEICCFARKIPGDFVFQRYTVIKSELDLRQLHILNQSSSKNNTLRHHLNACCHVGPHINEHTCPSLLNAIQFSVKRRSGGQRLHTTGRQEQPI